MRNVASFESKLLEIEEAEEDLILIWLYLGSWMLNF